MITVQALHKRYGDKVAVEGRTIFVSSHLLSEMSLMADELVVIGRGRMIYHGDVDGFVREFTQPTVLVRSPHADRLAAALGDVEVLGDGALRVSGMDAADVGEVAYRNDVMVWELTTQTATESAEEYMGGGVA